MPSKRKALYWIAGMVPTEQDRAEAKALGITAFRNASQVGDSTVGLERADLVAGAVPVGYLAMEGCQIAPQPAPAPTVAEPPKGKAGK